MIWHKRGVLERHILLTACVGALLTACNPANERGSNHLATMIEESEPASITGIFDNDSNTYRLLMIDYASALGSEAGFYERCVDADTSVIKETLAAVVALEASMPRRVLNEMDNEFEAARKRASGCNKAGRPQMLRSKAEEAAEARKRFYCLMMWEHGGAWKPDSRWNEVVRGEGPYLQWMQQCARNTV